jgi:hypothetical protein
MGASPKIDIRATNAGSQPTYIIGVNGAFTNREPQGMNVQDDLDWPHNRTCPLVCQIISHDVFTGEPYPAIDLRSNDWFSSDPAATRGPSRKITIGIIDKPE